MPVENPTGVQKIMALLLFLDDEPDTLRTLEKAVQLLGHKACLAHNSRQAIDFVLQQPPDLIFVDMQLGETDGLSVVRELCEPGSPAAAIPIVMLSAGGQWDAPSRARQAGVEAYLLKPIRLQTLLETIEKFVSPSSPT